MNYREFLGEPVTIDSRMPKGTIIFFNKDFQAQHVLNNVLDQNGALIPGGYIVLNHTWKRTCLVCLGEFETKVLMCAVCDDCVKDAKSGFKKSLIRQGE